jgi:hypothetical protein
MLVLDDSNRLSEPAINIRENLNFGIITKALSIIPDGMILGALSSHFVQGTKQK